MDTPSPAEDPERIPFQDHDADHWKQRKDEDIPFPACRYIMVVVAFLGVVISYSYRVNMSVALVSMVATTNQSQGTNYTVTEDDECLTEEMYTNNTVMHISKKGEFHYTKQQQGMILGSFYYGYICSQILGGMLAEKVGGKHVFGTGVLLPSVLNLLTPVVARTSYVLLVVLRIIQGFAGQIVHFFGYIFLILLIGQGVVFSALFVIISHWAPPLERTRISTFILAGCEFGTLFAMPISGIMGDNLGWTSIFYFFGSLGCLWWVFWLFLVYDTPRSHPRISGAERDYIEAMIHMKKHTNGILSALPSLASWATANVVGLLADCLRARCNVRTVVVRKAYTSIGMLGPAIFLILAGHVGCDRSLVVAMIVVAGAVSGFFIPGAVTNTLDIAPRFAGTLFGITNTASGCTGILAPLGVASLIGKENTREQWLIIFYIAGAIYVVGAIVYLIFASGVEQEWAKTPSDVKENWQKSQVTHLKNGQVCEKKDMEVDDVLVIT